MTTTSDTPHDPKGAAGKLKLQLHLLPPLLLTETAAALANGAAKYGAFNYRKPGTRIVRSTYTSAILRHVMAIQNGEDRCPESGVTHLGHIAANCAILLDAEACGTLEDDRVLPEARAAVAAWRAANPEITAAYADAAGRPKVHNPAGIQLPYGGYRFLCENEWIESGDEYWSPLHGIWRPSEHLTGDRIEAGRSSLTYRRKSSPKAPEITGIRHHNVARLLKGYGSPRPLYGGVMEQPPQDNLPAINQSLRETNAAHEKTIAELDELLRKTTEERDAALTAGRPVHNPAGLESPGEGYRFMRVGDLLNSESEFWEAVSGRWEFRGCLPEHALTKDHIATYRTRL